MQSDQVGETNTGGWPSLARCRRLASAGQMPAADRTIALLPMPALREHETLLDVAETVAVELVEHAACAMSASVPSSNPFDEGDA
jgi:hypothetical protein